MSSLAQRSKGALTSVFWTSTKIAADASTADNSSTASTVMNSEPPAPPSASGVSIPISPSSKHLGMRVASMAAAFSIAAERGRTSCSAKSRTASRNICSSSLSRVRGAAAVVVAMRANLPRYLWGGRPMHSEPVIARGTCRVLFAYDVAQAIDLDAAAARLAAERQTVKHKRRAPAFFEYRPPPLRVTFPGVAHAVGSHATAPAVDIVLYDFGAVSASYEIPLAGPLGALPALADALWGHAGLLADSRRQVETLLGALGDAAVRPRIADSVEDYAIFHVESFTAPLAGAALWEEHGHTVAQILRAEPRALSQQEVGDALSSRLAFGAA